MSILRLPPCAPRALALTALAVACGREAPPAATPEVTVEAVRIEPERLRDVATFSGALAAENSVEVKAETGGIIEEILFAEGQFVKQGDVLLRLRDDEQEAKLREAEANLGLARHMFERTRELATREAVSQAQQDRVAADLAVAQAHVDLARVDLARTRILAPFDGVVGQRRKAPGDRILSKDGLVQIDAVARLQVSFAMSERGILVARGGAPVAVHVSPYPGESFPGEVFFVSPAIDPSTRRVIVKAWVPNPDGRLRPGLFANVDLEVGVRENALVVPEAAVVFDPEGTYVWRLDGEHVATRVPVELGLRKPGRVEVRLGLQPGDLIVSAGTHKVMAGARVAIAAPTALGQARGSASPEADGEGT